MKLALTLSVVTSNSLARADRTAADSVSSSCSVWTRMVVAPSLVTLASCADAAERTASVARVS